MGAAQPIPHDVAIAGLEGNLWDMWAAFGRGDGGVLVDTPEVLRFETPIPYVPYNTILRSHFGADAAADDQIDATLRSYLDRDVPLVWVLHPTATPSDLEHRLEERGLVEAEVCPGMVAPLDALPDPEATPPGIVIEQLGPASRTAFVELVAWRYSLPADAAPHLLSIMANHGFGEPGCPTMGWIATKDGVVVSKVIIHLGAGVAGLYGVATRAEARGLGLARLLTSLAFRHARELGYTVGVLHSTPMAVDLYAGLGFRPVADFRLFSTPDTVHL